ncbi:AAA family ATPase [Yersinia ruckeri]|uniref:AAA family ATPase n=1 Tax=Yersinia ruckeri TaxID=29486 RepID=UPI0022379B8E|nr:AAA family ATPase [Yersinia ruckeri]MCW6598769.1 AAA family ATPase [Yersinia ruckeri]
MSKFSRFQVKNGMSFGDLDINLDQPGMNLIMGENLDDISGNSSRNGCGKSNIFTLLNYHLFERGLDLVNARSKNAIINSEIGKDYLSQCMWQPSQFTEGFVTSYQYQRFSDWGNGAYLIKNGSWEDVENRKEGVEDISLWKSPDTQAMFSELVNMSWQEWNLLVNLTNVDDDKDDPFFTTRDKIQRMELFQSLFKMDYSAAHTEVKNRLTNLRRQIESDSTTIESALAVLRSQLEELESEEELKAKAQAARETVERYTVAIAQLSQKIESRQAQLLLIQEYDQLKDALVQSSIEVELFKNNDIREQYDACRTNLEATVQAMSDLRVQITEMKQYETLATRLAQAEESAKFYLEAGYTIESIRQKITDNNAAVSQQYRYQQLLGKYSWLTDYGQDIPTSASHIRQYSSDIVAELTQKLADFDTEKSQISNEQSAHTFIVNQLLPKSKKLLAELVTCTQTYNEQEPNQQFVDANAQYETAKDAQYGVRLKLSEAKNSLSQSQHQMEHLSSGVCPTCNQTLPDFEDIEKSRMELQTVLDGHSQAIQTLEAEIAASEVNLQELKVNAQKYEQFNRAKVNLESIKRQIEELMGEEAPKLSEQFLSEKEAESREVLLKGHTRLAEIDKEHRVMAQKISQLNSVVVDELDFILNHKQCIVTELESENAQLNSISQVLVSLQEQRSNIEPVKVRVQGLLDESHTSDSLQTLLQQHSEYAEQARAYIAWAEAVLPMLDRINDSKFDDIESVRWMMEGAEDLSDDQMSLDNMRHCLKEDQETLSNAEYSLKSRKSLEDRIRQQESQNEELAQSRKRFTALQVLDVMCGPNGMAYSRLERIFQEINVLMNNYMSVLIPEGMNQNKRVTTYFEMTSNGPIQTVYRGDTPIARLSRSEKARVKLARTLALREFSLPAKRCNILLLDELDGSSCDTNKERIWDCVRMHVDRFPSTSVWAVSHSPEMQTSAIWDRTFKVSKKQSMSILEQL